MAISIKSLRRTENTDPPRTFTYGRPKIGKTTLIAEFPKNFWIQTEQGTPAGLEITSFGKISSYQDVLDAIMVLAENETGAKYVTIDTADRLDTHINNLVCKENKWANIEEPGYGKGYVIAGYYWKQLLYGTPTHPGLQGLVDLGIGVNLIGHSEIITFNDPTSKTYNKWEIRLNKHVLGIVQDWCDLIMHLDVAVGVVEDPMAFSKKKTRVRADGGTQRWITTDGAANLTAGSRYPGMPKKFPYMIGHGYETLSKYFPHVNGGVLPPEPAGEDETNTTETTEQAA